MRITVAICTWNRAKLLDQTLLRLRELRIPEGVDWELLVVNNNCTDDTDAVIARHADALPLRRLHEPKQGHSNARNCAVDAARGDLLIWTDDDVLVEPTWLVEYVQAANRYPEASFFAGTVDPWFETEPPGWIRENLDRLRSPYVIIQNGIDVRLLTQDDALAGANFAFRTDKLRLFPFDSHLGRMKSQLVGADDSDVVDRMRQAGCQGVWVGTARVRHFIPTERLSRRFVTNWFFGAGRTLFRQQPLAQCKSLWGAPRWALRLYYESLFRLMLFSVWGGPRWFDAFRTAASMRGIIYESRLQRRRVNLRA